MIDALGPVARFLHTGGVCLALGAWVVCTLSDERDAGLIAQLRRIAVGALLIAVVGAVGALGAQAASLAAGGDVGSAVTFSLVQRVLLDTRYGHVWALCTAFTLGALGLSMAGIVTAWRHGAAVLLGASALALPWSGHSAALDPAWPTLVAHSLHVLGAAVWLGSLVPLALVLRRTPAQQGRTNAPIVFARFSRIAMVCMAAIVASGVWLAIQHTERWPALLGTTYGALLIGKLAALMLVLAMAAQLRWRVLPPLVRGVASPDATLRWLGIEIAAAIAILALATALGQTIPARHDAIRWWLPFRVSVDATWDQPWVPLQALGGGGLVLVAALGLAAHVRRRADLRARTLGAAILVAAAGATTAVHALSVPAYPDTYRTPSVPYETISVARGASLFAEHCARCHGSSAHGDGPAAASLPQPPADLTEPHTALHTAGDIFWWLTHGKPPGVMPGIADRASEDDRWDIINFLRTLSAGYQARILTERVVPARPWLGAVDFGYAESSGNGGALRDSRERETVLLVFFRHPTSAGRIAVLTREAERLRAAGVRILAVPMRAADADSSPGLPIVTEGVAETATTYSLFRRTLSDADPRDARPVPEHMELLVDRFGYVRARWLPAASPGWSDIDALLREAERLHDEPRIRPPPDDHVH